MCEGSIKDNSLQSLFKKTLRSLNTHIPINTYTVNKALHKSKKKSLPINSNNYTICVRYTDKESLIVGQNL